MAIYGVELTITYTAWDTSTNAPKDSDVDNHTIRLIRDGVKVSPTNEPIEVENGEYALTLTTAEMQAKAITVEGSSSTPNVTIVPTKISTLNLADNADEIIAAIQELQVEVRPTRTILGPCERQVKTSYYKG